MDGDRIAASPRRGTGSSMPRRTNVPAFSPFLDRYRNLAERFFNRLNHFSTIATRYEKHAANDLAIVKLASICIWLRAYESVP